MPRTYSQILLHIVFSTRHRQPWLTDDLTERVYQYIGGIIRDEGGTLLAAGGIEDHVHLYVRWRQDVSVSDLMRHVKGRSSRWIHQTFPNLGDFEWQEGFAVFSVNLSSEKKLKDYIANQAEHHSSGGFEAELIAMLKKHRIEFDQRYLLE